MRVLLIASLAACASAPKSIHHDQPAEPAPPAEMIRFVGITEHRATFFRASPAGIVTEKAVELPNGIGALDWVDHDPVVLLASQPWDDHATDRIGEVGRITPAGYVKLELPAWPDDPAPPKPEFQMTKLETPMYTFAVDADREMWLGRCDYYGGPDGGWCDHYRFMRVDDNTHAITLNQPSDRAPYPPPAIAPSQTTVVALVELAFP